MSTVTANAFCSALDELSFPGLPTQPGADLAALQYQLEQTQWWSREKLISFQMEQLQQLFRHAASTSSYYAALFQAAGFTSDSNVTPELISRLPILERPALQNRLPEIASRSLPQSHGQPHQIKSSGSTGRPVTLFGTTVTNLMWHAITLREHLWHQRDLSLKLAAIRSSPPGKATYPEGKRSSNWGGSTQPIFSTGPSAMLNSATPVDQQAKWLMREQPHYLLSAPTLIRELAMFFIEHDLQLQSLQQVRTFSEALPDGLEALCHQAWGCGLVDIYSCREVGYMALQCPVTGHYHVQSENVYLEVVDDNGAPCRPGQSGKVLITSLNNFATPLIRYEIGDHAEVGAPECECGRGLPVLTRILGRVRNMLALPNGSKIWTNLGYKEFCKLAPINQYQVIQHSLEDVEMRLVTERQLTANEEQAIRKILIKYLRHPFPIRFSYLENIPRSSSDKFEEFISHVN